MQAGARREDSLGRDIKVDVEDLLSTREASTIGISSFDVPFDQLELDRTCDFLIETVQLNDGFEDPTPVVDLPGKGRVKLPRVPTTSAELEHTPSKYPGPFNFQLQFIDDSGGKPVPRATPFTYSPQAQRLFVQMNHKVPFRFSISDRVPNGTWLRIRTRFTQPEFRNEPVVRCPNHRQEDGADGMHAYHLVRCDMPEAVYEKDATGHYSIRIPFDRCAAQNGTHVFYIELLCFSSCPGGLNRRPFEVTVSLEHSSRILGCDSIDTRVCACPGRDRGAAEKRLRGDIGKKRGRKKKKPPTEPTVSMQDDNKIHTLLVQGRTHYAILHHLVEGLDATVASSSSPPPSSSSSAAAAVLSSSAARNQAPSAVHTHAPGHGHTHAAATATAGGDQGGRGEKRTAHDHHDHITHALGAIDPHPHKRSKRRDKPLSEASFPAGNDAEETPGGDTEPESEADDDNDEEEDEQQQLTPRQQVKYAFLNLRLQEAVRAWLSALRLEAYADMFMSKGYDDLDVVCDLTQDDLDCLGISRPGHRKKLLLAAQKLKSLLHQARAVEAVPDRRLHKTLSISRTTYRQALPSAD